MARVMIWDIESYLYKAITACKVFQQCKTDKCIWGEYYDVRKGHKFIQENLDRLMDKLFCQEVVFVIGDSENFRKKTNPEYKANRPAKPDLYYPLLDYLQQQYGQFQSLKNLEADDTCRIIYEDDNFFGGYDKVIVSIDKDFYSVPCTFYRDLPTNTEGSVTISKEEADYNLMKQIIMGDTADNYKGITGYGEKKTETFLNEGKKTLADVCELFRKEGLTGSEYVKNKVCATIVGIKQYNFNTGEVKLTEV